jgi:hypothetical protein
VFGGDSRDIKRLAIRKSKEAVGLFAFYGCPVLYFQTKQYKTWKL